MPSHAYTNHLEVLLADAEELDSAHTRLRTGQRGRQWGLGAINRAVVVLCVSSWETALRVARMSGNTESYLPIAIERASGFRGQNGEATKTTLTCSRLGRSDDDSDESTNSPLF